MNRPLTIELEASAELEAATLWYESQRPGLGAEFLDSLDAALRHIGRWPKAGAPVPDLADDLPVRRVPVGRFPYHVVYLEMAEEIRVVAIAHDRRQPGYWQSRNPK
ncbi:MAG: type II toxin-antitoxin system RelE/ParE family toxin [Terriglobales bacterium]